MIDPSQFRQYVIQPVLKSLGLYSPSAENLLALTTAVESHGGHYLHQLGKGPAVGPYQMEPATHDDIWGNFLRYKSAEQFRDVSTYLSRLGAAGASELAERVRGWQIPGLYDDDNAREMAGNLYYATAMCRIHYLRRPEPLPRENDDRALATYWKTHFNTYLGAGTIDEAVAKYREYGKVA